MKFPIDQICKYFVVGTMIAGAAIVASAVVPMAAHARGFSGPPSTCRPPVDANGWTIFSSPHKIFYFSSSAGLDTYTATQAQNPATPWKTIDGNTSNIKAQAQTDIGLPDWFVLKKGDLFPPNPPGNSGFATYGENCANPMVFGSYDPAFPGVVDPYDALPVTSITCSGTTEIVNTASQSWTGTEQVDIVQELPGAFNGEYPATVNSSTQIQFTVASCPASSDTLHGQIALARPIVEISYGNQCWPKAGFPNYGSYTAFVGWNCYGYQADPSNASFSPEAWLEGAGASGYGSGTSGNTGVLFEDVEWTFLPSGGINYITGPNLTNNYLSIRRNVNKAFGTYTSNTNYAEFYENNSLYDDWNPTLESANPVTINATPTPAVFTWGGSGPLLFANDGSGHCSFVEFTGASLPTYSEAATFSNSGTGVIQATNNFVAHQAVVFSGAGLPTGITSGVTYYVLAAGLNTAQFEVTTTLTGTVAVSYTGTGSGTVAASLGGGGVANAFPGSPLFSVVGISGNTFSIDLNCAGGGIALSGAGSSVEAYWGGSNTNQTGYNAAYPQPSEFQHSYYLQNAENDGIGTPNITLLGNIIAFTSGAGCECQGWEFGNLLFQNSIGMSGTKMGAIPENLNFLTAYNGLFEISPYYYWPTPYNGGDWGFPLAPRLGTYTLDHNLLAYESQGTPASDVGIIPGSNNNYPDATTFLTSNVACGIGTPIKATQGSPVTFGTITNQGTGYPLLQQVNEYLTATQDGIQLVSLTGHGAGFGAAVWVDGKANVVVGADLEYAINGEGYQVGDLLAPNGNSQLGNSGSGASIPVSAVQGPGFVSLLGTAYTAGSAASGQNTLAFAPYYLSWLTNGMTVWDNTTGSSYTYIPSGTTVTGTAITTPGTFTGTISGSVLTASSVTGTLAVGQQINGAGVTPGSFISSFGTGSGGAGTYNLNQSDAAIGTPEAMTATIETVTISNNLTTTLPNNHAVRFANGGSGYYAPTFVAMSGGSGTNLDSDVTVNSLGNVIAAYPLAGYGTGYTTSDVVSPVLAHTVAAQVPISSVVNNVMTNNTYQEANCQNLQLGGDQLSYYQQPNSVAPAGDTNPLFSKTPPTDPIGTYFCNLPYGYSAPIPAPLVGYSSGCEQGFMQAAGMQQKALWDKNLTAFAVLNWARPQFGILNPPGTPLEYQ